MRLGCFDKASRAMAFQPDSFNDAVGTKAIRHIDNMLLELFVLIIERFRSSRARHGEPLRYGIDGDHAARAEKKAGADGKLADGTESKYEDRTAFRYVGFFRRHVPGRENVGEKQNLLICQAIRNLD